MKHYSNPTLKANIIETPLGSMIAIADQEKLYGLEFQDNVDQCISSLSHRSNSIIVRGESSPICSIRRELELYFRGQLSTFKTPIITHGTEFQQLVWQGLQKIPHGQTISYATLAISINRPTAHRAVANANAKNRLAIIIPCHRVINHNGKLGGYAGGIPRKKCLIDHEKAFAID